MMQQQGFVVCDIPEVKNALVSDAQHSRIREWLRK